MSYIGLTNPLGSLAGSATASGSNTAIQFNDSSQINGVTALTFNKTSNTVTIDATGDISLNSVSYKNFLYTEIHRIYGGL